MNYLLPVLFLVFISCNSSTHDVSQSDNAQEDSKFAQGKAIYDRSCVLCHQESGLGLEGLYPPLAKSDYLLKDKERLVHNILFGVEGEITVNGNQYDGIMPPQVLSDEEIVAVSNYVLNAWGNAGGEVTLATVEKVKNAQ
jgi:nitrite reductase (NO-forming)